MATAFTATTEQSPSGGEDFKCSMQYLNQEDLDALKTRLTLTRGQRVRAALFPETLSQQEQQHESLFPPFQSLDPAGRPTSALGQLAGPARDLKEALADLVNYVRDADFAAKFIPELTKLLADQDRDVVRNAAELCHGLSQSEAACRVFNASPPLVAALTRALTAAHAASAATVATAGTTGRKEGRKMKEAATGALFNMSKFDQGRLTLFKTGGIGLLVRLLEAPAEKVVFYAISTLHNLLRYQEGAKAAVRIAGGIQRMVPLLKWKDAKFLAIDLDCLHLMTFGDPDSKMAVSNSKGPRELIDLMRRTTEDQVLWTASRLLKVLSTCDHNKDGLVESGGIQVIANRLKTTQETKVLLNFWTTLRNLSDAETDIPVDDALVSHILQFISPKKRMQNGDPGIDTTMYSAGILANLSCSRPQVKEAICNFGGVEIVLKCLKSNPAAAEPLLCLLRHLTSSSCSSSERTRHDLRTLGGLDLVVTALSPFQGQGQGQGQQGHWTKAKSACGLVRNLLHHWEIRNELMGRKIVPKLAQLLALAVCEREKRDAGDVAAAGDDDDDDLKSAAEDIIESSIVAFLVLVRNDDADDPEADDDAESHSGSRREVSELAVRPLLKKLLKEDYPDSVREACKALLEELGPGADEDDLEQQQQQQQQQDADRSGSVTQGTRALPRISTIHEAEEPIVAASTASATSMTSTASSSMRVERSVTATATTTTTTSTGTESNGQVYQEMAQGTYETVVEQQQLSQPPKNGHLYVRKTSPLPSPQGTRRVQATEYMDSEV